MANSGYSTMALFSLTGSSGGGKASGLLVVSKLPAIGEEQMLYKVKNDYTDDDGNLIKRGIYSWDNISSSFTFVAGASFIDWTDELKDVKWNKDNGVFDNTHNTKLFEINGQRFLYCKFTFNDPLLDITEPNKVLELPFSYDKPFKVLIGIHQHKGDKFYEGMRHDFYDSDGEHYIDPQHYREITLPIKDLQVEEINNKLYAHQVIDAKGDLIFSNNFMSNVAPWLEYDEVNINAQTDTEVDKVKRPYKCLQQWVELELTTDPTHRYDKKPLPSLMVTGSSDQYRYMYFDEENNELYYGDTRYNYKIGTEAERTFDNIGDFYIATDTMKIYRYIQNLYETEKATFKINADFMYNLALMNAGCRVMVDGKVARMTSTGNFDDDFCIYPDSFDGTYEWIPDDQYETDTGIMAEVRGNSIYAGGAIDSIEIGGAM